MQVIAALQSRCLFTIIASIGLIYTAGSAKADTATETAEQRNQRMAWWREARFGMFIHWGLYSVPAGVWNGKPVSCFGEWIMHGKYGAKIPVKEYEQLAARFNPTKFDAHQWVAIAKNAGMKYIIITTKHHDGFAMFHSKTDPSFNIYDSTPFHRDPMKELAEECRKQDIKLGFYYSIGVDWHHPGAARGAQIEPWDDAQKGDMTEYVRKVAAPQVRELLSEYGPVSILWWDGGDDMTKERTAIIQPLLKLQPGLITNNRLGEGCNGDTETPEGVIPPTGFPRDWETCMTMNNTWGYRSDDQNWKTTETLVRNLVDIASKGGNYLLNIGPTGEGLIPQTSIDRMAEIGKWTAVNGEAIYGTTASPYSQQLAWGRCTQKPGRLYLHVFDWPNGKLLVPRLSNHVLKAYLLADPSRTPLKTTRYADGVAVELPAAAPDKIASVVVLEIDGKPNIAPLVATEAADGTITLASLNAVVHGKATQPDLVNLHVCISSWRENAWASLEFQTTTPGTFDVEITFACDNACAGSEYLLAVGEQTLPGKVEGTGGGWGNFVTKKLGSLHLVQPGRFTLSVKPKDMSRPMVMNLETITLRRVKP